MMVAEKDTDPLVKSKYCLELFYNYVPLAE